MKERPILFSGAMVRALLAGTKTQTRRVVKHKWPQLWTEPHYPTGRVLTDLPNQPGAFMEFRHRSQDARDYQGSPASTLIPCPHGQPGDRLWVRESAWFDKAPVGKLPLRCFFEGNEVRYADGSISRAPYCATAEIFSLNSSVKLRPSIHMPRWASRLTLDLVSVRVERLQDISEADALAEGIVRQPDGGYGLADTTHYHATDPRICYWSLWDHINGADSVEKNPFVWVLGFPSTTAQA